MGNILYGLAVVVMGNILYGLAVVVFLIVGALRTIILSATMNIQCKKSRLFLASTAGLLISLVAALVIHSGRHGRFLDYMIFYGIISPYWPFAVILLVIALSIATLPGYFIERRILIKGGMSVDTASKTSQYSSVFLLILAAILIVVCYAITMKIF